MSNSAERLMRYLSEHVWVSIEHAVSEGYKDAVEEIVTAGLATKQMLTGTPIVVINSRSDIAKVVEQKPRPYRAWYSPTQAKIYGTVIWRNAQGTEIECIIAGEDGVDAPMWSDAQDRGPVVEFVRLGKPADPTLIKETYEKYE